MDDDYWDVESDEEMPDQTDDRDEDTIILSRDFSLIRRIHVESSNELAIRRYDAFIYEGILSRYKAEQVANPLKNPKTARVFAHYIHVTGPVRLPTLPFAACTDIDSSSSQYPSTKETLRIPMLSSKAPRRDLNRTCTHTYCLSRR